MEGVEALLKQIEKQKMELEQIINSTEDLDCPNILQMSKMVDDLLSKYYRFLGYLSEKNSMEDKTDRKG